MLQIYNTLTRQKESFTPVEPGKVRMYVCGITVYDYCHIGHARMMVAFDVVQRWLRRSYEVSYVRNITDIDDKIIKRAVERNLSCKALTEQFIAAMDEDLALLGVAKPDHEPRATQYLPQMLNLVSLLQQNGLSYQSSDGDMNFSVRKFPGYGKLSGKSLDDLRAGERVALNSGKEDPLDFVLWKSAKAEEPAEVKWESAYGVGRPGWHLECSAMASSLLGQTLDIHGGGADLQFPHHENEIAQSEGAWHFDAANGQAKGGKFVNTWMHNGFVQVDNEKMSKSLGNFFTIREVVQKFAPEVLRFFIIRSHYRSPLNYSDVHLEDARQGLLRLYNALSKNASASNAPASAESEASTSSIRSANERFTAAMNDDFNTPIAVSVLFDLANEFNRTGSAQIRAELQRLAGILNLLQSDPAATIQSGLLVQAKADNGLDDASIEAAVAARALAKKEKRFADADRLRKELSAQGINLEDGPQGTRWRRA